MAIKFIILAIISAVDILMALFFWYRNPREAKTMAYVGVLLCGGLWGFSILGMEIVPNLVWAAYCYRAAFFVAMGTVVCLTIFAFIYPYPARQFSLFDAWSLLISSAIMSLIIFKPDFLVLRVVDVEGGARGAIINFYGEVIFIVYFVLMLAWAFNELFRKWRQFDGIYKWQLKYLLIGLGLGYFFGALFNLFLIMLGNFQYVWLGPYFTLSAVIGTTYAVFFWDGNRVRGS